MKAQASLEASIFHLQDINRKLGELEDNRMQLIDTASTKEGRLHDLTGVGRSKKYEGWGHRNTVVRQGSDTILTCFTGFAPEYYSSVDQEYSTNISINYASGRLSD